MVDLESYPASAESSSVPCKLNNAKTNKTPWTIIMDCLRNSCTNENSQRKFLSKFARQIIQNLILESKGFKIQFFESLILAQDERWRRA